MQSAQVDRDDLYQEGMLGLLYAARTYDGQRSACFEAYAGMCIKCRMIDYLRKQMTDKKKTAILVRKLDEGGEGTVSDPEEILLSEERAKEITENLSESFSGLEKEVFSLRIVGFTPEEIADKLKKSRKSVENALTRIKNKLRKAYN